MIIQNDGWRQQFDVLISKLVEDIASNQRHFEEWRDLENFIEQQRLEAQIEVLEEVMIPVTNNDSDDSIEEDCSKCFSRCAYKHKKLKELKNENS